ncbi:MAG: PAS domain-containing protein [Rhodocyclaceae bacterium]|nr:PAS domain-containing protein [Rhodocyclaceae bacterium]
MSTERLIHWFEAPISLTREHLPESFRRSLRYFNLYRLVVAGLFLAAVIAYDLAPAVGAADPVRFMRLCAAYLLLAVIILALPARMQARFDLVLTAGVMVDIVCLTLMMHQSGGVRSGFAYMLLVALAGAGLVGQGRLTLFHAAIAALAVLLEQSWRVLTDIGEPTEFFPAGVMSLGFFGTAITARLLASRVLANEELARRQGEALEAQQHINQRVIRDMQDGVLVVDGDGSVRQCNPQAVALFGFDEGQATRLSQFSTALQERFSVWWSGGRETSELIRTTEGQRLLRVRFLPPGERGNALLYIEDMDQVQAQAQQIKLAALGRLAANMAHEIRNPLASISHAAELLREEHRDDMHARLTRIIGDNTQRLDRIVNEVLELGRRDRAAPEVIRLNEFCAGLIDELSLKTPQLQHTVVLQFEPELLVRFDRGHLHRVLSNLITNALRYSSPAPGAIRLLADRLSAEYVELHVIDDGAGVSETLSGQIFEPFFTTHAGGTGLGLYIARELCEANGAVLQLRENDPGAHFCIQFQGEA